MKATQYYKNDTQHVSQKIKFSIFKLVQHKLDDFKGLVLNRNVTKLLRKTKADKTTNKRPLFQ